MRAIQGTAVPNTVPGADRTLVPKLDLSGATFRTRLDEVARGSFAPETVASWKAELHAGRAESKRQAELHAWIGESLLAAEEPDRSEFHFRAALRLAPNGEAAGAAAYDLAAARFFEGRYAGAGHLFRALLKSKRGGYDRKNAAMFARHAQSCAGYHAGHEALGIPQPERLDPLCGTSAIAVSLRALGMPYDQARLTRIVPRSGMGSSFGQLRDGAKALGLTAHAVETTDKGLRAMPKPVLAHVERDHYVSVVRADEEGVAYVCSDCGRWPGGEIRVTWKQWRAMEADAYLALVRPGSPEDRAYAALRAGQNPRTFGVTAARGRPQGSAAATASARNLLAAMSGSVTAFLMFPAAVYCGQKPDALHCSPPQCCPMQRAGASAHGPSGGDPVNLATGEEEYTPSPDLSVYNPTGPSLSWGRTFNSLGTYTSGFGPGWSHPYNLSVQFTAEPIVEAGGEIGPPGEIGDNPPEPNYRLNGFVMFPNGSRASFSGTSPTSTTPQKSMTVPNGYPILLTANYDSVSGGFTFTVTNEDRSKWTTLPSTAAFQTGTHPNLSPAEMLAPIARLADRVGNWISFSYGTYTTWNNGYNGAIKRLTGVYDSAGLPLMTLGLTSDGYITSANDRYGRSVYYSIGTYGTTNVPNGYQTSYRLLNGVSIIVPTGTTNPLVRYQYGYSQHQTSHYSQVLPFLHTISVPSPTGTGMATSTIDYDVNCYVTSVVDANGNRTEFTDTSAGGANETTVKVKDPQGNVVWQQKKQYDAGMNETKLINGVGQTVWTKSYGSGQTPFEATSITDGNGRTWQATYDKYNHLLTSTTPKGIVTTNTWSVANFALGELIETKTGSKTSTQFDYDPNNGLVLAVRAPIPGDVGTGNRQTTSYSYDLVGNLIQVLSPGNDSVAQHSVTFGYTTDGSYTQAERLRKPITITDSLGKVTHMRYDVRGNLLSVTDALGNATTMTYSIVGQPLVVTRPATGQTGTGNATQTSNYLYPTGPLVQRLSQDESGSTVRSVSYTHGAEGEELARTGSAEAVSYVYDPLYRPKSLSDGNAGATATAYDLAGRVTQIAYSGAGSTASDKVQFTSYDAVGNLLSRTDGNGQVTNYTYADTDGLLTGVAYPGQTAYNVTYAYDLYDRLTSHTDGTGSATTAYDDLNRTTSATRTYTGVPTMPTAFTYWPDGARRTMVNVAGTWTYGYDADGRYASLSSPGGAASATYFDNGWQSGRTLPNGTTTSYAYNAAGALTGLLNADASNAVLSQYGGFAYDGVSNLTGVTATVPGLTALSGTTTFAYDAKDRLTNETATRGGGYSDTFAYDAAGNPTTFKGAAQTFNADNQRTGTGFVYDGNGNPTTYAGSALGFDPESRATSIGANWTAGYRADGLRAWKQTASGRTYYLYDQGKPVLEFDSSRQVLRTNVYAPDGLVASKDHASGIWMDFAFDPQGNVSHRQGWFGGTASRSAYDAYGVESGSAIPAGAGDGFGYNARWGYVLDRETGLYLCQRRYYDPARGRWLNRDPIGAAGGVNVYAYCLGNPMMRQDANGLNPAAVAPVVGEAAPSIIAGVEGSVGAATGATTTIAAGGGATIIGGVGVVGAGIAAGVTLVGVGIGVGIGAGLDHVTGGGWGQYWCGVFGMDCEGENELPPDILPSRPCPESAKRKPRPGKRPPFPGKYPDLPPGSVWLDMINHLKDLSDEECWDYVNRLKAMGASFSDVYRASRICEEK